MAKGSTRTKRKTARNAGDLLTAYREKRDFSKTHEPSGEDAQRDESRTRLSFCVQKHDATRLHYDFRIEWDGVLKSWAVTKGPSLDPADKRLAVRTEDHPLAYGDFEGVIPKKEYGGGTVMLWDRGSWEAREDPDQGFEKGSLKLRLAGEKMKGDWALVRMKPRKGEKRENWLLIKEKDEEVDRRRNLLKLDRSVKTGRAMEEIAAADETLEDARPSETAKIRNAAKAESQEATDAMREHFSQSEDRKAKGARSAGADKRGSVLPAFVKPQLATLVEAAPEGEDWLSEMKYDGYRVLIAVGGGKARLFTRNEKDWTVTFTGIAKAALALDCESALIDGEVVAFDDAGRTDFSALQAALSDGAPLSCFCFDILELDGKDLRERPLIERKTILRDLVPDVKDATLLYSEHVEGNGLAVFDHLCGKGYEGIVAKRADAPYRSGRSKSWLKVKCTRRQEFVIGGFSPSEKAGRPFSSILVGVQDGERFVYRGRVGSGFTGDTLHDLAGTFKSLSRKTSPFADLPRSVARGARFVTPKLVAEIEFAELTADGQIRHGVFKGLREDKEPEEVTGEGTASGGRPTSGAVSRGAGRRKAMTEKNETEEGRTRDTAQVAGIRITHPDRVVFTEHGLTKGELAAYYEKVADRMLAHTGDRPLSLVRCPEGPTKHCFFQKHASKGFPDAVGSVSLREKDGSKADYLTVSDGAGLVGAVQMNTLEFHIWGSRNDRLEKPDRLVFDLDPDEGLGFAEVKRAAYDLRDALDEIGLVTFALVTGGKGIHVVAPLERRQTWDELKAFASSFSNRFSRKQPKRFTANMSKAKRKGRIFIDWLRNERGSTAIAPYSTRSRKGAPVAMPVSWEELETLSAANTFDPATALRRLNQADPWAEYGNQRQSITKAMLEKL
ncbi:hypothetical protein FP2506_04556 [Fulvimarina pelagi HTCC2506]|uniref:DNA ligase (ATP) n=2 Tax=Fulvimarina pelagi TaxID=217511 RepID=Q0FZX1_9HYPH|nr:DNA ligase D [Fulvimarina pelagi]EAU40470.1 hypothetical protein FP2506_04556 [Fulvimarina pelagi HTCC2506]BAT31498.1 ATP dependent DNA ligase [Fulvimarina pelagi]